MRIFTFIGRCSFILCLLLFSSYKIRAQRIYADDQRNGREGLLCANCIVQNAGNAVDGNPQTYSVINVAVGLAASTYQELIFTGSTKPAANTPIRIKLGTGDNLADLTLLGGLSIRAYNGAATAGPSYSAATLLTAVSNNNQFEVGFTPTQTYDRIRVTLNGGLLGVLSNLYVYDSYFYGPGPAPCNTAVDELHGISAGLLNLGVDVGGVANPQNAIDGNINTASTLNAGVNIAGAYAQQTVIFSSPSVIGDSVRVTLGIPQGLIDAGVLSRISLNTFSGNANNNDEIYFNSALLSVRLLDLEGNRRRVTITYAPGSTFDRVQLRLGSSLANVLSTLNFYEANRVIPRPVISFNGTATNTVQSCAGSSVTLTAGTVPNTVFNWYTASTGGTPVFTGNSFTTPALNANTTYYVSASRAGCTDASDRTAVTINVNPIPAAPVVANNTLSVCPGQQATFSAPAVTGVSVRWYTTATGGVPVFTGNTFTTGALTTDTVFYAEAIAGGTCISPTRTQVTATINPLPATPVLSNSTVTICTGGTAAFNIAAPVSGVIYRWYATPTGGTPVFTGANFTTPALTANTSYYVEAENATGCISTARSQATVSVQVLPAAPVLAANNLTINAGQAAAITVSNAQTGVTYNWYTSATASTPVFTGITYTTPALFISTSYYVEAVNAAGCSAATRTSITINVAIDNNSPCTFANAQTSSVNGLCVGCSIINGALATDADTTTYSTVNVLAGLSGGYAEQELRFQQPGFAGDTLRFEIQTPVSIADVNVAGSIEIALYNNTTQVVRYGLDNGLVKLRPIGGSNRYMVSVPATGSYDRATIRLNSGVASLLTSLRVYYALQTYPAPVLASIPEICAGSTAQLNITSPATGVFNWYTTPTGGTPVYTGANFTTPQLTANTIYYIENLRNGCAGSVRYPVQVLVGDPPAKPVVVPASASINSGETITLTANVANNTVVKWYTSASGGTPVFTGTSFTTPELTSNTTYYAESSTGGCTNPDRTAVTITVVPAVVPDVAVTPPTQSVNPGSSATLTATSTTAGVIFNWYTTPTGGTSIYTGATFNTPAVFNNTTYYAEAVVEVTGVRSAVRAAGLVNVNATDETPVPCDAAISQTTDVNGLICIGCSVANATGAVDADANTFSRLNVPVGLLNAYAQQTLRFANTGRAGDSLIVELGIPGTLADVGVLSQIAIATYNGNTYNNDRFTLNGSLLNVRLVNGTSRVRIAFRTGADFDRVEVRLNAAVAGLFDGLNIYSASQAVAAPVITNASVAACEGTQATLTATVPDHVTVRWYTTPTGGTPVFTGNVFNTPALTANVTYYAEASRTASGCVQTVRTPVSITVTLQPDVPVVSVPNATICANTTATFAAQPVTGVTFNWYSVPTGGTPVFTGATFITPALTASTSYYVEATAGACGSSARTQVTANVTPAPLVPQIAQAGTETCSGSSAVLTATSTEPGVTFRWYTTATGGNPVFTGAQFTTPELSSSTSYYVEAVNGECVSDSRAQANVTVNPAPDNPTVVVTPAGGQVSSGQSASITASSATAGATFRWYTSASGGTPIFTGTTFTTPALSSTTTYYVEASIAATGCVSVSRTPVTITVNPVFSTNCDLASTQTNDVNGGLACVGCTISDADNSVNTDTTDFSQLNLPISGGGSYVAQTLVFADAGLAGDTVKLKMSVPASLTSAAVLQRLQIASFNGATYNNDRVNLNSGISLQLLGNGQTAIIKFVPATVYDRVEIRLNSVAAAVFNTLNVYYASKQIEQPQVAAGTLNICSGSTATFTVNNERAGVIYRWYSTPTGGVPLFTGTSFTTPELSTTATYYVESVRETNNCANPGRVAVTANVTPLPANPVFADNSTVICAGESVTLTVTNANGATVRWYNAATNGTLLFTGASYIVTPVTNAVYYAELSNGDCTSPTRTAANVTVNQRPSAPGVQNANVQVCPGETAVLQVANPEAGVTYRWYSAATGGTALFAGTAYTTPAVTANSIYYVEAATTSTGCINNGGRTAVNVIINDAPAAPALSAALTQVCNGGSVTITVVNPVTGHIYNWYTVATGGTPIFTGTSFTVNGVTTDGVYYVEAVSSSSCVSSTRTQTNIDVLPIPQQPQATLAGGGNAVCAGSAATLVITNPQADLVYRWYTSLTGGTPVFTGTEYTTPALSANTTYYVEAANAGNCASSARTAVNVTVSTLPATPVLADADISVCSGGTATFTISSPQAGLTYNWYDSPARTNLLFTGTAYTTPVVTANKTFYISAINSTGCASNNVAIAEVTLSPSPQAPVITQGASVQTCAGNTVTLTVSNAESGSSYRWFTGATGGSPVFTGTVYSPVVTASSTYYVEALNAGGCASSTRTSVTVTVVPPPAAPQITSQNAGICPGSSATLTATSATGTTIRWYTSQTGGTPVFTGTSFNTPALNTSTTYYAEAVFDNGGCTSLTRKAVQVIVFQQLAALVVSITETNTSSVTISWTSITGAGGYQVSVDNGQTFTDAGNTTTYTVTGLQSGETISIVVRAIGTADCQTSSNSVLVKATARTPDNLIFVPNAFTPNGDGNNDILYVYGSVIKSMTFNVYTQWGENIFRSNTQANGWDGTYKGTRQPVGVYVYYLDIVTNDGQKIFKKGTITLLR
ncbi:gliding motility-associated C-terminal domain-containing protein [Mucilaginibacter sp. UR6-1]|uniref:Ig-like domain-containing protein n=1 Tax=Mucilaginibacter sp. UR6-1 TaxID=1435643 RepID=UPI001E5B9F9D|nr:gliding motility-associated C-terminal domain-containing protein [Mucilaginibacter sp. UR6-1]MCC8408224.1 gliding motility-associated C-terminal domain-containing protein [Mucilaginibacter sp. UR6-1]